MYSTTKTFCALMVCAALIGQANAQVSKWVNNQSAPWNTPTAWDPEGTPGIGDDAVHKTKLNHIQVDADEAVWNFEGDGGSPNDRFLLIESTNQWKVRHYLLATSAASRFPVKLEDARFEPFRNPEGSS